MKAIKEINEDIAQWVNSSDGNCCLVLMADKETDRVAVSIRNNKDEELVRLLTGCAAHSEKMSELIIDVYTKIVERAVVNPAFGHGKLRKKAEEIKRLIKIDLNNESNEDRFSN